jgi:hypothetical protein
MRVHVQQAGKRLTVLRIIEHKELSLVGQIDIHIESEEPDVLVMYGIDELRERVAALNT